MSVEDILALCEQKKQGDTYLLDSMKQELAALKKYGRDKPYDKARILLYSGLLEDDAIKIKRAGEILHENEGMEGVYDRLLWSFIPSYYYREIDYIWDGIGEWRC